MACELVFGYAGESHVTGAQLSRLVEGIAGDGRFVLPTQNGLAASMESTTTCRVQTGDLVFDGRLVSMESYTDLTVESGVSGYNRRDLVVCRYVQDAGTGVESCTLEVIKGTATTGTAQDPAYNTGSISEGAATADFPLYRITLAGIAPGKPEKLFETWEGVSDALDDRVRPWHKGDVITYQGVCNGYVTSGGCQVNLGLPMARPIGSDVKKITATGTMVIRQNGKYIFGSASGQANINSYSPQVRTDASGAHFWMTASKALPNVTNNDTLGAYVNLKLTLS